MAGEAQLSAHCVALCKNYRNAVVINSYLSPPADQIPRRVDRSDQRLMQHGVGLLKFLTTPKSYIETFGTGRVSSLYITLYPH